jgi:tRNA threonylcarbamoyladenosine biosynthesis protein TsaE
MQQTPRRLESLNALREEAAQFVRALAAPRSAGAAVVGLSGDLGAGKTAFVQEVARALGVAEPVTSPTFVIMKSYALVPEFQQAFDRLVHIDAYRLDDPRELAALRLPAILEDPRALVFVEWPEKTGAYLPAHAQRVILAAQPDGAHTIAYA